MNPKQYLEDTIFLLYQYPYAINNIVHCIYDNREDNELIEYFKKYHIKIAYKAYSHYYNNKHCDNSVYVNFFKIVFNKNLFDRLLYEKRLIHRFLSLSDVKNYERMILSYEKNNI